MRFATKRIVVVNITCQKSFLVNKSIMSIAGTIQLKFNVLDLLQSLNMNVWKGWGSRSKTWNSNLTGNSQKMSQCKNYNPVKLNSNFPETCLGENLSHFFKEGNHDCVQKNLQWNIYIKGKMKNWQTYGTRVLIMRNVMNKQDRKGTWQTFFTPAIYIVGHKIFNDVILVYD